MKLAKLERKSERAARPRARRRAAVKLELRLQRRTMHLPDAFTRWLLRTMRAAPWWAT